MCSLLRNRFRKNSLRYYGRDYSIPGKYFVTICTAQKTEWFGSIIDGEMHLSEIGHIAAKMWYEIPMHFQFICLDAFVVMPDHIHGIIVINKHIVTSLAGSLHATTLPQHDAAKPIDKNMSSISPKSGSLSVVVRSYKSAVSNHARKSNRHFAWQPKFHDTIICTSGQLKRIRKYVSDNPKNWNEAVAIALLGTL
jgi:REP element-mobilizing transposase RayT